jgi:hypothetical protein
MVDYKFISLQAYKGAMKKKYTLVLSYPSSNKKYKESNSLTLYKKIHFGSSVSTTYVEGADEETRKAYIARHSVNEDFSKLGPASASRYILWGESKIISENLKDFMKKFNIQYNIK